MPSARKMQSQNDRSWLSPAFWTLGKILGTRPPKQMANRKWLPLCAAHCSQRNTCHESVESEKGVVSKMISGLPWVAPRIDPLLGLWCLIPYKWRHGMALPKALDRPHHCHPLPFPGARCTCHHFQARAKDLIPPEHQASLLLPTILTIWPCS